MNAKESQKENIHSHASSIAIGIDTYVAKSVTIKANVIIVVMQAQQIAETQLIANSKVNESRPLMKE